ncbi:MAG: helix-turn-helix domain-containing protein [Candidatus Methanoperedens sp.]|nr:helix-turn-helix domain-containing protein [Candidatus Methanoperedens sp.]
MPENDARPGEEKLLILPLGEESKKIAQIISNDTARQIIELLADAPLSASDIAEKLSAPITTVVYNLEKLDSVGLIRVERIKYSEKGREVKIYAPVRKLIVVVPEKTDRNSVTDLLRKYLGVILAAVLASSLIEFFTRRMGRSMKMAESTDHVLTGAPVPDSAVPLPGATGVPYSVVNETAGGIESYKGAAVPPDVTPAAAITRESVTPAATSAVVAPAQPASWDVNTTAIPSPAPVSMPEGGTMSKAVPDILTRAADTISAHPGIVFLLGCLFAVVLLMVLDYHRRRKNG